MIDTLVVDDDYRVAGIHADYVSRVEGFRVVDTVHTGADALERVRTLRPDLVLLDLYLPDEHGLGWMRRLDEVAPPRPDVIVITAARDLASVRQAMQQGSVHYLVKPFRFAALKERLEAYRDLHVQLGQLGEHAGTEADQAEVDRLFQLLRTPANPVTRKGQSASTMRLVREAVRTADPDLSAAEVSALVGVSRPTAQRYLAYLAQEGVIEVRLQYGSTGRPEHRYRPVGRPS